MTRNNLTDILASCLDSIERGERTVEECLALYPEHREELKSLLSTVVFVRERTGFSPRPGYRPVSRARLLGRLVPHRSAALREPAPRTQPIFSKRFAMLWAAVFVLVVSLLGGGTAYASNSALPGDALHPVKLSIEDARLFLAGDAEDVSLAAGFAQIRLEEMKSLIELNREEDLSLAVDLFSNRIANAADSLAAVSRNDPERAAQLGSALEESLSHHAETLNSLLMTVPDEAKPAIENALLASSRGRNIVRRLMENRPPGGGPPEEIPGANPRDADPPKGNPNPGANPPGGGPPQGIPNPSKTPPAGGKPGSSPGKPTWVPGGNR
jgi:hypothetical protein